MVQHSSHTFVLDRMDLFKEKGVRHGIEQEALHDSKFKGNNGHPVPHFRSQMLKKGSAYVCVCVTTLCRARIGLRENSVEAEPLL